MHFDLTFKGKIRLEKQFSFNKEDFRANEQKNEYYKKMTKSKRNKEREGVFIL